MARPSNYRLSSRLNSFDVTIDRSVHEPQYPGTLFELYRLRLRDNVVDDLHLDSDVTALKVPRPKLSNSQASEAEVRLAAEIQVYDWLEQVRPDHGGQWPFAPWIASSREGEPALMLKWLTGYTFLQEADSRLQANTLALAAQLFEALAIIHSLNNGTVIHRDIRPENILLSNETLVIIDFGHALTGPGNYTAIQYGPDSSIGAPNWPSAPETNDHGVQAQPADVWTSAQAILFGLTGKTLSRERSNQVSMRRMGIDPRLARVLRGALDRDPNRRPTASQIAKELRTVDQTPRPHAAAAKRAPARRTNPKIEIEFEQLISAGTELEAMMEAESPSWAKTRVDTRAQPNAPQPPMTIVEQPPLQHRDQDSQRRLLLIAAIVTFIALVLIAIGLQIAQ